jgi:hypothetical protein
MHGTNVNILLECTICCVGINFTFGMGQNNLKKLFIKRRNSTTDGCRKYVYGRAGLAIYCNRGLQE